MARNAPIFDSGIIPAAGSGNIMVFLNTMIAKLTEYQSNGEDAWELIKQIDTGADFEAVYKSVGDRTKGSGANKGDTQLFVYIHKSTTDDVVVRTAQDFSDAASTWATGVVREAGSGNVLTNITDTGQIKWWSCCNEYEFLFVWEWSGVFGQFSLGVPIRPYSDKMDGIGRTTSQSGTGNGVVFGLDRDISSNIKVGQKVWFVNRTPTGVARQNVGVDICEVKAVTSNSITVDGVTNTYSNGSLCGVDPAAMYFDTGSPVSSVYFTSKLDGTYVSATGQQASCINPGATYITPGDFDPGLDGLYLGFQPIFKMSTYPSGLRGKRQHMRTFPKGGINDADIVEVDFDSAQRWMCFTTASGYWDAYWAMGMGPM